MVSYYALLGDGREATVQDRRVRPVAAAEDIGMTGDPPASGGDVCMFGPRPGKVATLAAVRPWPPIFGADYHENLALTVLHRVSAQYGPTWDVKGNPFTETSPQRGDHLRREVGDLFPRLGDRDAGWALHVTGWRHGNGWIRRDWPTCPEWGLGCKECVPPGFPDPADESWEGFEDWERELRSLGRPWCAGVDWNPPSKPTR